MSIDALLEQLDSQRRKVDFDTYDIIVQQLVSMVESGAIDVAPAYQRQFRWDGLRRAQLVESVFLGVPIPSLFMASNKDGTWELVDGVQRLSTLVQYAGTSGARAKLNLTEPLALTGLTKLSEFDGLTFDDLPDSLQLQFYHRPIKVITLSDKSDLIVRFDLFERLNTGGVALSNQEIRACIYRGRFSEFLQAMAEKPAFHAVVRLTRRQEDDGTRVECALRFFAFLSRYTHFEHSVVEFLNDYMDKASKSFNYASQQKLFERTFTQLSELFPGGIARRAGRKTTPINLFEAVAVGAALALKQQDRLSSADVNAWIDSEELRQLTTGATNNRNMVVGRIEYCRDRFLEA